MASKASYLREWTYVSILTYVETQLQLKAWTLKDTEGGRTIWFPALDVPMNESELLDIRRAYVEAGRKCYVVKSRDGYGLELWQ